MWSTHALFERLPRVVNSILLLVLALFLLVLYFTQKGHVEYLWLALHELVQAPIGFVELAGGSARLDTLWYAAIVLQLVLISAYLYFEFLIAFLSLRRCWYIKKVRYPVNLLSFYIAGFLLGVEALSLLLPVGLAAPPSASLFIIIHADHRSLAHRLVGFRPSSPSIIATLDAATLKPDCFSSRWC